MPITQADKQTFADQGFLHVKGLLDAERDLGPLHTEYQMVVANAADDMVAKGIIPSTHADLPFDERVGALYEQSDGAIHRYLDISLPQKGVTLETPLHCGPAIFAIMRHPKLLDAVEAFIGPEVYSNPTQHVRIKPPAKRLENHTTISSEIGTTVWHQDQGTVTADSDETNLLTVWIAVTEATRENGCLLVAPGSHRGGLAVHCHDARKNFGGQAIPDRLVGEERVALEAEPGDVIFLNKMTMHASLPNRTDRLRWSLDLRYNPIGQPTGRGWFPGFVARSRSAPETELTSAASWQALWAEARRNLIENPPASFQRWSESDPGCA